MIYIEIIPNLWIGNNDILKYKDKLNIDFIINCSKDLHFLGKHTQYKLDNPHKPTHKINNTQNNPQNNPHTKYST